MCIRDSSTGMPLFWQERKNTTFWGQMLADLSVKAVFDLSPGSGQLARACLDHGVLYSGVAKDLTHASILNKVLDRHTLKLVGQKGSACHDADLAALVKAHFNDVTEMLDQQDQVGDSEVKDDEELEN